MAARNACHQLKTFYYIAAIKTKNQFQFQFQFQFHVLNSTSYNSYIVYHTKKELNFKDIKQLQKDNKLIQK